MKTSRSLNGELSKHHCRPLAFLFLASHTLPPVLLGETNPLD